VAGRHVLLIDDVCTTGATLGALATALRAAGAAAVWALTVAQPHLGDDATAPPAGARVRNASH
jgi:adenine/guanine phosphoribosyltransferase-like PRPP-binding protein